MLYILLAGGIFNAVLVPQLVRAMTHDPDGGDAYTNRVVTLAALFLGVVTVAAGRRGAVGDVARSSAAPATRPTWPRSASRSIAFARFCLPQVFFYGMFVLVGQILNARGRFGPMMWAPIANNVISVGVLVVYLLVFGTGLGPSCGGFTPARSSCSASARRSGIAVQLLILVPYLRAAGFRFRPRFDFRDAGPRAHAAAGPLDGAASSSSTSSPTPSSSGWPASGTAEAALGACSPATQATGYTVYSTAFLIVMVPHSVVTVSLATAILPRLSAARGRRRPARAWRAPWSGRCARCWWSIVPFAALLPVLAPDLANLLLGHGATKESYSLYVPTLSLFGVGLFFFTLHYLMLRGFYALERTRTVFWVQCAVALTNIVAAVVLVPRVDPVDTAPVARRRLRRVVRRRRDGVVRRPGARARPGSGRRRAGAVRGPAGGHRGDDDRGGLPASSASPTPPGARTRTGWCRPALLVVVGALAVATYLGLARMLHAARGDRGVGHGDRQAPQAPTRLTRGALRWPENDPDREREGDRAHVDPAR